MKKESVVWRPRGYMDLWIGELRVRPSPFMDKSKKKIYYAGQKALAKAASFLNEIFGIIVIFTPERQWTGYEFQIRMPIDRRLVYWRGSDVSPNFYRGFAKGHSWYRRFRLSVSKAGKVQPLQPSGKIRSLNEFRNEPVCLQLRDDFKEGGAASHLYSLRSIPQRRKE